MNLGVHRKNIEYIIMFAIIIVYVLIFVEGTLLYRIFSISLITLIWIIILIIYRSIVLPSKRKIINIPKKSKIKLIEILLIITSIFVALQAKDLPDGFLTMFMLFFAFSILYYILINNKIKNKFSINLCVKFISVCFSGFMAYYIAYSTINLLKQYSLPIFLAYYLVFIYILNNALKY